HGRVVEIALPETVEKSSDRAIHRRDRAVVVVDHRRLLVRADVAPPTEDLFPDVVLSLDRDRMHTGRDPLVHEVGSRGVRPMGIEIVEEKEERCRPLAHLPEADVGYLLAGTMVLVATTRRHLVVVVEPSGEAELGADHRTGHGAGIAVSDHGELL